ncbi:thiol-disulfide isomerase/thioredoxin [Roseibium marinum]|uniref:Thiol-disulfide isomerase/thioredoxin n=2 Tax=Roseibium marinum TaxID=281252 RepID=A0A2S3UL18_9HYPH|nr:thiol-disulfide isomerase/thioredoxin [Roseibium marinum]
MAVAGGPAYAEEDDLRALGLSRPLIAIETPELGIADLQGDIHRLDDYRGKTVIVSFWAAWCPPCRKELPTLARLRRQLGSDDFAVLAVNAGDREDRIRAFLEGIDSDGLIVLADTKRTLSGTWFIKGLPVTYILNRSGQAVLTAIGDRIWDSPRMIAAIRSLG